MTHAYQSATEKIERSWKRIHGNGEQTQVHIISAGERYMAVAVDIDPREFSPVESELVAFTPTLQGSKQQAIAWMEQHPKGIVGENGGSGGSRIMGAIRKLNDYGNDLADQQQTAED